MPRGSQWTEAEDTAIERAGKATTPDDCSASPASSDVATMRS